MERYQGMAFSEILSVMRATSLAGYPIVTGSNRLVGYITREDLQDRVINPLASNR